MRERVGSSALLIIRSVSKVALLTSMLAFASDMGTDNLWFWACIVHGVAGSFGKTGYAHRRVTRRTNVSRDGTARTTVEEETS